LVAKLARKRPSPIGRGDADVWAAGALYAIGQNNFLFDPIQTPHLCADDLSLMTGVHKSTMAASAVYPSIRSRSSRWRYLRCWTERTRRRDTHRRSCM
jgi:hypothetical protein